MDRSAWRAHWVRHNKLTRIPRTHICLDSEATQHGDEHSSIQRFRCAVASCDRRYHHRDGWAGREWCATLDRSVLWDWIDARTGRRARTVLCAHNLAYDLRITDAFHELPARGWTLKAIRLDAGQAWCTWRNGERSLVCVDTMSWVNASIDTLGAHVGLHKLDLPAWTDSDEAWLDRCRRDVEILAETWRRILDWIVAEDLGNWKATGAGQSWAAYRHRFMAYPLLVHEDTDARAAERSAAHTGRAEAWQHGNIAHGPFTEWDATAAYCRIGWGCDVPVKLHGELHNVADADIVQVARKQAVLAEVDVTTDVPVVPVRTDDGIVWPTGTFRTTLWDCELDMVRAYGGTVKPARAWWYRRKPALHDFCAWVLERIDERNVDVDPVVRLVAKHWSRSLIGRMAAQYSTFDTFGRSPVFDVALSRLLDDSGVDHRRLLQVGYQLMTSGPKQESPDSMVAIMSWIMARCRADLWATMRAAGLDNVVYVDTDSVVVNDAGNTLLGLARIPGLRVKGRYATARVYGPRQIVLGGRLRAAGIPSGAREVGPEAWRGDVWEGLGASIARGAPDEVAISSRTFRVLATDRRRQHNADGSTSARNLPAG